MPRYFEKCLVLLQNAWRRVSHFAKCRHFVKCLGILQNDGFLKLPATYTQSLFSVSAEDRPGPPSTPLPSGPAVCDWTCETIRRAVNDSE